MLTRRRFLATSFGAALAASTPARAQNDLASVGVIGHTGRGNYGHGLDTMWAGIDGVKVAGFADADGKGRESERRNLPGVPAFADYREMLAQTKPEIVAVAPRHVDEHRDMVLAAIAAGARGIYAEKPFCRTPAEADEIIAACEKAGARLAVAHRNRHHPVLPVVKKALADGAIGKLLEIRGRGKEDARGGALDLWVLGSHVLNLVHYFGGRPLAGSAVMLAGNRPATPADVTDGAEGVGPIAGDRVHARYEMECGVPAYFDSIRGSGSAPAGFGLQLIGTKGLFDFRIDSEPLAHFVPGNPFQPQKEPRPWIAVSSAGAGQPEPIQGLAKKVSSHELAGRDLLAAVTENRQPLCSAEDGRVIVEMICAVFASHVASGARVTFPLAAREHPFAGW